MRAILLIVPIDGENVARVHLLSLQNGDLYFVSVHHMATVTRLKGQKTDALSLVRNVQYRRSSFW